MSLVKKIKTVIAEVRRAKYDNQEVRLLMGALLAKNISTSQTLSEAEFRVFSQYGDDGIIQLLIKRLSISTDTFVEFGVETYEEANTRFLLLYNNWKGIIIDGSKQNIDYIKNDPIYWRHELTAVHSFITSENINLLLSNNGLSGRIGLLSIDIDGNDYWIWQAITVIEPDVVVIEYNSLFGSERSISTPYSPDFVRTSAHYSNLYFGASLTALCDLGKTKEYSFVGCNIAGNNAYFVKNHLLNDLPILMPSEGYKKAKFRESLNRNSELTFALEEDRKKEIIGLPVVNTRTGLVESI